MTCSRLQVCLPPAPSALDESDWPVPPLGLPVGVVATPPAAAVALLLVLLPGATDACVGAPVVLPKTPFPSLPAAEACSADTVVFAAGLGLGLGLALELVCACPVVGPWLGGLVAGLGPSLHDTQHIPSVLSSPKADAQYLSPPHPICIAKVSGGLSRYGSSP